MYYSLFGFSNFNTILGMKYNYTNTLFDSAIRKHKLITCMYTYIYIHVHIHVYTCTCILYNVYTCTLYNVYTHINEVI